MFYPAINPVKLFFKKRGHGSPLTYGTSACRNLKGFSDVVLPSGDLVYHEFLKGVGLRI